MVMRWRLVGLCVVAGLVLAFPSGGSAVVAQAPVELTPTGPVPATLTLVSGLPVYPVWHNADTVTHSVSFADGLCSIQVPPGATMGCDLSWDVGQYAYTVDGTTQARITMAPDPRIVTLSASSHTIERGAYLRLHGLLSYGAAGGEPDSYPYLTFMPVVVLARHDRHHPFRQVANAATGLGSITANGNTDWPWWLNARPNATTIYIVEVNYQPDAGQIWQDATSKPFKIVVRARR
jgi:hypothetical protein